MASGGYPEADFWVIIIHGIAHQSMSCYSTSTKAQVCMARSQSMAIFRLEVHLQAGA